MKDVGVRCQQVYSLSPERWKMMIMEDIARDMFKHRGDGCAVGQLLLDVNRSGCADGDGVRCLPQIWQVVVHMERALYGRNVFTPHCRIIEMLPLLYIRPLYFTVTN
jgi:hypothetical protein